MKYIYYGTMGSDWATRTEDRWELVAPKLQELGIVIEALYYTQGEFDFVEVVECDDPQAVLAYSIWMAKEGIARTRTMPAFSKENFDDACKQV